jgi:3-oxoadipate enol-lactonase
MQARGNNMEIRTGDIVVCYDDLGEGELPLLFIHGFPFSKTMWQPQMEALKHAHRVIAYDIRGFGRTNPGNEKPSITLFADDLINFMDLMQINKAIVCGLSMGGYILLNAVDRYPERFEAIILCDTQCIADSSEIKEKRHKTIEQVEQNGVKAFVENFIKTAFCEETLNNKKDRVEKIKEIMLSTPLPTITKTLKALAERQETCFALPGMRMPALIICGKQDMITPVIQSEYLYEHLIHSTLHTIDNAAHLSNWEQADAFNQHVLNFLSSMQSTLEINKSAIDTRH